MPNIIDANGLQIKTVEEIKDDLETGYKVIYGNDIIVDSNSPDGQRIALEAQESRDFLETLQSVNNSFDPDQAEGVTLAQRGALQGIQPQGATYSLQTVDVTVSAPVNLQGLDADFNDPDGVGYTVADDAGTEFILANSVSLLVGTTPLTFRAADLGSVTTIPNTITNPVTIVLEVVSVDNPTGILELGLDQESDASFRLRRQQSFGLGSKGYNDGLTAALLNIEGVTSALVKENRTSIIVDTIPAHGIWCIVEGGASDDIGLAIYTKFNFGADQKGAVEVDVPQDNGDIFVAKYDESLSEDLWIRFNIMATETGVTFDEAAIKDYMVANKFYNINEISETSSLTCLARDAIDASGGGGVPLSLEISDDNITYVDELATSTFQHKFIMDSVRILITVLP